MVTVEPFSKEWAARFREQEAALATALGSRVEAVEHIGSTAVPGLAAKPVIDIAARAAAGTDPFALAQALSALGYTVHASGPKTHAVYVRGRAGTRTEILHVFAHDAWDDCNQRLFCDRLRRDPDARRRYTSLKRSLAATTDDGRDYTAGKTAFVQAVVDEERRARGLPRADVWEK